MTPKPQDCHDASDLIDLLWHLSRARSISSSQQSVPAKREAVIYSNKLKSAAAHQQRQTSQTQGNKRDCLVPSRAKFLQTAHKTNRLEPFLPSLRRTAQMRPR